MTKSYQPKNPMSQWAKIAAEKMEKKAEKNLKEPQAQLKTATTS